MTIKIHIKKTLIFSFVFILFTIVGTVSHEYGHIVVAKSLGYETTLHYNRIDYSNSVLNNKLADIYKENKSAIDNGTDFDQKDEYEKTVHELTSDSLFITLGGPLQTIITGTIGLLLLLWRRKKIIVNGLKFTDWIAIFLSLFWLREFFNVARSVGSELISPNGSYFGGDEKSISEILNLWAGVIPIGLGTIGLSISLFVIFKIVSNRLRLTFILSGFIGSIVGYLLWMYVLGPQLL